MHITAQKKPSDHRILLVNDDGIHARGITVLEEIARRFTDDVWVVAPDEERSGASRSLSLSVPIRVRQLDERHFAVKGTPTDCVLLAAWEILADRRPTLVLSGINHGPNLAEDVNYSGTAAAAMEAAALGMRAIALSQHCVIGGHLRWDTAKAWAARALEPLLNCPWEPGSFVNVNFPDTPPDQVRGLRTTTQGRRLPGSFRPSAGVDGRHAPYYWIRIAYDVGACDADTDLAAIEGHAVSITPMQLDLTSHGFRQSLAPLFDKAGGQWADEPPSATSTEPLQYDDSSEAR